MTLPEDEGTGTRPSPMRSWKDRRTAVLQALYDDVKVPHWDDPDEVSDETGVENSPVYIRCYPVDHDIISKGIRAAEDAKSAKKAAAELEASIDVLIQATGEKGGVFTVIDGEIYSLTGKHNEFDPLGPELAFALGMADKLEDCKQITSRQIIRRLFFTQGDIMAASGRVIAFSGYKESEADEKIKGES